MRSWMLVAVVLGLCGCPEEKKADAQGDSSSKKTESSAKSGDSAKPADSGKKEEKKDEGGW